MSKRYQTEEPARYLPRDDYTSRRRELEGHPEAFKARSTIDIEGLFGETTTWVVDLYRVDGDVTAFVQVGTPDPDDYIRLVLPPKVTAAIARHQQALTTRARRRTAKRVIEERRERGDKIGNPEALRKAAAMRKKK